MSLGLVPFDNTFQFTLPRGERLGLSYPICDLRCFNSRSREGSDPREHPITTSIGCFNSRSREGSDRSSAVLSALTPSFNSRSREGSDIGRLRAS